MKKKLYTAIYYVALIVAIGSAAYIGWYYFELYQSDKQVEKIQDLVMIEPTDDSSGSQENPGESNTSPGVVNIKIDFPTLKTINSDAVGWVRIDNTRVDYPVVQANDNEYYLNRNVFKKYDRQGAVFMDYRNVMSDQNIILYAHNMKNGNMFADVAKYKSIEQLKKHPVLTLLIDEDTIRFEVIGAFYYNTKQDDYQYLRINFNDAEREEYLSFLNSRNLYGHITIESNDQLLTLSTCNYDSKGDRFVLILKNISRI